MVCVMIMVTSFTSVTYHCFLPTRVPDWHLEMQYRLGRQNGRTECASNLGCAIVRVLATLFLLSELLDIYANLHQWTSCPGAIFLVSGEV